MIAVRARGAGLGLVGPQNMPCLGTPKFWAKPRALHHCPSKKSSTCFSGLTNSKIEKIGQNRGSRRHYSLKTAQWGTGGAGSVVGLGHFVFACVAPYWAQTAAILNDSNFWDATYQEVGLFRGTPEHFFV